jgi:16S rRNA (uracil1498-N3)-methyltransferase
VDAERTEKGLERGAEKRLSRWRRIALESSQQSRRRRLPEISDWVRFADALKTDAPVKLFLDEENTGQHLLPLLQARSTDRRIAILIGPEGGWTDAERQQASAAQWVSTSLGPQILRAETAVMAALSIINAVYETV